MEFKKQIRMNQHAKILNITLSLIILFCGSIMGQEIDLVSLSQLEDSANSGKTIKINKSFNLNGNTINIADGIILKPFGGILANGIIGGDDFIISSTKRNKTFDLSIDFENKYPHTFYPEWYGARGDGITNDTPAIKKAISVADTIELRQYRTYYLNDPLDSNRAGTIVVNGSGAKIIARGFADNIPMIKFGNAFSQVVVENLKIDGESKNGWAINVKSSFRASELDIQNMYATTHTAYGINAEITKTSYVLIKDSYINNIRALGNDKIGDGIGASRAIAINWFGSFPNSNARIVNNTLKNVIGEDGDVIQVAQNRGDYDNNNKTVIQGNYIAFGTRRLIKASASNVEVYGNTFEIFQEGDPNSELNPDDRTYQIAFQTFQSGDVGKDANFVLGAVFSNNTFIAADPTIDYANGGTLGLQQTKGAIVQNNKFNNSRVVFNLFNQDALVTNNTFTNSNIDFIRDAYTFNNCRITKNTGTIDCRAITRPVKAVISFANSNTIDGLVIDDNKFMVNDGCININFKIIEIAFFSKDPGGSTENLTVTNNTLIRGETFNNTPATNPIFLRTTRDKLDAASTIADNRIVSENENARTGLNFIDSAPPFPFTYQNNILDLPNNTDAEDPVLTPNGYNPQVLKQFLDNEKSEQFIQISPNPVNEYIKINTKDQQASINYQIFNMQGKRIVNEKNITSQEINVSILLPGIYFLSIQTDNHSFRKKIVKK